MAGCVEAPGDAVLAGGGDPAVAWLVDESAMMKSGGRTRSTQEQHGEENQVIMYPICHGYRFNPAFRGPFRRYST